MRAEPRHASHIARRPRPAGAVLVAVIALVLAAGCAGDDAQEVRTVSSDGMLEWFNRPAAVSDGAGRTWIASLAGRSVEVAEIDGSGARVGGASLDTYDTQDDHGAPVLARDRTGHLLCFYALHTSQLAVRRSVGPDDASEWQEPVIVEADGATYPQPHVLPSGDVLLFYRWHEGGGSSVEVYRTSGDGGATWSGRTVFARVAPPGVGAVYAMSDEHSGTIDVAWSVFETTGPVWRDVYHVSGTPGGGWTRSDGSTVTLPVTDDTADLVARTGTTDRVYVVDVRSAGPGDPRILYASGLSGTEPNIRHARLGDSGWVTETLCPSPSVSSGKSISGAEGHFPCGAALRPGDPDSALVAEGRSGTSARDNADCTARIALWRRTDDGWRRERFVATDTREGFDMRPQFLANGSAPAAIWVRATRYPDFHDWASSLTGWFPSEAGGGS